MRARIATRFHDCQAQLRAFQLNLRDGRVDRLVIVVKATHANRRAVGAAASVLDGTLPAATRTLGAALAAGRDPGANGLMFILQRSRGGRGAAHDGHAARL